MLNSSNALQAIQLAPENVPVSQHPHPDIVEVRDVKTIDSSLESERVAAIAPLKREEPVVTRRELWSYYLYYNGDNGVGPLGYSITLFQSLATAAGFDPVKGPGSSCSAPDASGQCVLPWAGGVKAVSSIVLISNGVCFAVMTLIFTTIGSAADYAQFASISLTSPSRWGAAMGLYMIGFITYGATLVFYAALFPRLARNTPHARQLREKFESGEVSAEEYEIEESMEKNRISNISTAHSNIGYIATLLLNLSLLLPLAGNPKVNNYVLVFTNGYWVLLGVWWFVFQQPRPGPPLPKGEHYLTIGWKQIWIALKQYKKLPYTFVYLVAFFLLADGFNTTGTLVLISITSTISTLGFWYIQRYWKISTKKMFAVTNIVTILIPLWGMIGIWTTKFGFHNVWEFWAYKRRRRALQAPYFAFSQTMMAELTPPGFDNMFFGLFGLSNRASSMIGPNVIQAIINNSGNNWKGFPFLFALCTAACLVIWFGVDVPTGRRDAVAWAGKHRSYAETGVLSAEDDVQSVASKDYAKKD
ncbi:Autophagy-related protein 22-1 [Grifola frondosa]|uniref:Autophagy-related protein n=1 Tax=Grifola frondosa TaxID=5627 RepID=A0A1C7M082_GRIFR|nr:Autophagy-related protein 22-1 [Grifola frondosa]